MDPGSSHGLTRTQLVTLPKDNDHVRERHQGNLNECDLLYFETTVGNIGCPL